MKKINTILAAVGALLMLSVTGANSLEFKAGVSANGMAAYANAKETLKDANGRTTNEEAILATSFASAFVEVSSDEVMGLGIGISYAPEVVDLEKETRTIQNVYGSGLSTANDSGDQVIDGKIQDLASIYLTLPIGDSGAYVKAGYIQATFITSENLATGSKYEDIDLTGTQVGGGYEAPLGDMAFWRAEGSMQMWEDISASGSESGGTSGSKNKITAELGSVVGTLSVGMKF
ncbi:MAG: hypothetical protein HON33_03415 [Flavobacteriaceae bacterium]|jgi:hypothetical protein|nr:hypothetical protein [Flavobacteriaceae bacterium]MBT5213428.1 hypothetical protein [Pelagibacteraceae bacterium]